MIALARLLFDLLFASLWQGACIAAVVAILLAVAGRRNNAATRYLVLECALVAVAIVPVATTLPYLQTHAASVTMSAKAAPVVSGGTLMRALPSRRVDLILNDPAVLALTAAWLAGVIFFALRIGIGSLKLTRLVRRSELLTRRDGVPIRVSSDVALPLAVGFAAPSVIVPPALAAAAGVELECAVLHELAHVARSDAWANAMDRVLHAVLFFHPGALLLLRWIALEREAACDDVAVAQSRDIAGYARSLATIAIAAARVRQPAAFGAVGFARSTVARIERLERSGRNGTTIISRFAFGGFVVVFAIIVLALQSFAPAVAFSAPTPIAPAMVASASCTVAVKPIDPVAPDVPSGTPKVTKAVTSEVAVRVSSTGAVLGTSLYKSSGRSDLDRATIAAAQKSTYAPAQQNCKPVAGSYLFAATFAPDTAH